jgi:hypothetical protein
MVLTLLKGTPKLATKGWKKKADSALEKSFKNLEKKMDKVGKERKIRKQKQDEEVTKRTGKPFKQMEDPE